jgi:hypothetical protein
LKLKVVFKSVAVNEDRQQGANRLKSCSFTAMQVSLHSAARYPSRMINLSKSVLTLAAAALSVAGCQREEPDAERREAAGAEEADELPWRQGPPPPTVELLSPGDEPRRELRYVFEPGTRERVTVELDMEMVLELADAPSPPVQLPRMQMVLDLAIEELAEGERAAADDAVRYTFELSEASALASDGVDPTVLRAVEQGLAQTVGTRGSAVVDARGFNRETRIDIPAGAPPETRQMMETTAQQMEQLASPLPAEPVGEGARWEVVQHLEQNGMAIVQTSVVTLLSIDGRRGRLETTIRQDAEPQVVDMPGAMAGATAELLELRSRGEGAIDFDLGRLMPLRGEMRSESQSRMQLDVGGGEPQSMTMHMELGVTIEGT